MTTTLHPTPRARIVVLEQVRAVGSALRRAAAIASALLVLATLLSAFALLRSGGAVDFAPELSMLPGILGFLLPIAVWRGEDRFGAGFLWTLPVDRRRHALAKVFAGWVWLIAAVTLLVLWMLGLALVSGGNVIAEQTLRLLPSPAMPEPGTLHPSAVTAVQWTPEPLLWLVPWTAATGGYLIASAIALGVRKPVRWMAAIVLGFLLVNMVGAAARADWLALAPGRLVESLHIGRYGLDTLLTGRTESLKTEVLLSTRETVGVWRGLPNVGDWALATLFWTSGGLVALWAAVSRHRETRRLRS